MLDGHKKPIRALISSGNYVSRCDQLHSFNDPTHLRRIRHLVCVARLAQLFSGSNDKTIRIWDMVDFECKFVLEEHDGWVRALTIAGTTMYSVSHDTTVKAWNVTSLDCEQSLSGAERLDSVVVWHDYLFVGADNGRLKVYKKGGDAPLLQMKEHRGAVLALVANRDLVFSASYDGSVRVWGLL